MFDILIWFVFFCEFDQSVLQHIPSEHQFTADAILRMEKLVLDTLNWRMQPITPCSFIDYFLSKIRDGQCPSKSSIYEAVDLILRTIQGLFFCWPKTYVVINCTMFLIISGILMKFGGFGQFGMQMSISCSAGHLRLLQLWHFVFQEKNKQNQTLTRQCLVLSRKSK